MHYICKNCEKEVKVMQKESIKNLAFLLEEKIDLKKSHWICVECGMEVQDSSLEILEQSFQINKPYLIN